MRCITVDEFHAELKAQGVSSQDHFAFRCPMCGAIQSAADLVAAGAGDSFEKVKSDLGFACVGRWTGAGGHKKGAPAGSGCDWSLGGLFKIHKLEIVASDQGRHPFFELATPQEAQAHEARRSALSETSPHGPLSVAR